MNDPRSDTWLKIDLIIFEKNKDRRELQKDHTKFSHKRIAP